MRVELSIDRFEGKRREIAVLLTDDGRQINFPRDLLPRGTKAGDILIVDIERDIEATKRLKKETRDLQKELEKTDSGGDIKI